MSAWHSPYSAVCLPAAGRRTNWWIVAEFAQRSPERVYDDMLCLNISSCSPRPLI